MLKGIHLNDEPADEASPEGVDSAVKRLATPRQANQLVVAHTKKVIRIDLENKLSQAVFDDDAKSIRDLAVSPSGRRVFLAVSGGDLLAWDPLQQVVDLWLTNELGDFCRLALTSDEHWLLTISGAMSNLVANWNSVGKLLPEAEFDEAYWAVFPIEGYWNGKPTTAMDGTGNQATTILMAWELKDGKRLKQTRPLFKGDLYGGEITCVLPIPDSQQFVTAGKGPWLSGTGYWLAAWDLQSAGPPRIKFGRQGQEYFDLAATPDGNTIFSAAAAGQITAWRLRDGSMLHQYRGHVGDVYSVQVSPDGRWLVSCGSDRSVRIWKTSGPRQIAAFTTDHQLHSAVFCQDSRTVIAGGRSGRLHYLELVGPDQWLIHQS
jgi:WD40 repeat protein